MSVTSTSIEDGILDDQIALLRNNVHQKTSFGAKEIADTIEKLKNIKYEYERLVGPPHNENNAFDGIDDNGNSSSGHFDDYLNQVECQVNVTFVGLGIPSSQNLKKKLAVVPHQFQLRGKSQVGAGFEQNNSTIASTESLAQGTKRKLDQNGTAKRAMRKISSNSFSNCLTPYKGPLEDMQITNLFDYWSWIEYQDIFNPSLKAESINELQFRPLVADVKLPKIVLPGSNKDYVNLPPYYDNLKGTEYYKCGSRSATTTDSDSNCTSGIASHYTVQTEENEYKVGNKDHDSIDHNENTVSNSHGQTNADNLPFYYQRLLSSLIMIDEKDAKDEASEDFSTVEEDKARECAKMCQFWPSVPPAEIVEDAFSLLIHNDARTSDEVKAGSLDTSEISVSQKTNGILGACRIIESKMIKYDERGVDILQERAQKERLDDQINVSLREMLREVKTLDYVVNDKIAHLRRNIFENKGVMGIKNDGELRKHREFEKSVYIKWEKYLKKVGLESFLSRTGAASLSLMVVPTQEKSVYAELPW